MTLVTQALRQRAGEVRALTDGEPVPSPCVSVCRMNADRTWCEGCRRSIAEITAWRGMSDEAKRATWQLIEQRLEGTE
jgi:predicted Fe-S protein YdhL (DUF1289 family)